MNSQPETELDGLKRQNIELAHKLEKCQFELSRSHEQQAATASLLKTISEFSGDLSLVFSQILQSATRLCDAAFGVLFRSDGDWLDVAATIGVPHKYSEFMQNRGRFRPDEGAPLYRVLKSKTPVYTADDMAESDPGPAARYGGARSLMAIPMLNGLTIIGALVIYRTEVRPFDPRQTQLVESFANQAVIAIENARLIKETQEALERQTATADILKVIGSSPSDVQPVFDAIADRSKRLVDALSTTVFRLEGGVLHLRAFTPTNPEADATLKTMFPAPLAGFSWSEAIGNGEIYRVVDTELEIEGLRELARLRGFRSMLFVPLLRDREPIGVIAVTRVEPGPFVEHHVNLLQTFADQAVIAIENVRLFNDTKEALERQAATADVLRVISGSVADTAPVFAEITRSCERLFTSGVAGLMLIGDDGLMHHVAWGQYHQRIENADDLIGAQFPRPVQDSIHGFAIQKRRVLNYPDVANGADVPKGLQRTAELVGHNYSIMVAPMLWEDRGIGALQIVRAPPMPFSEKDMSMLQTFADQAVIAIQNARMFEQVQTRTRELSTSLDELRAAQDRLVQTEKLASLGQLTAGIAHEIKNPLNFVNNFSALSVDLIAELGEALKLVKTDDINRKEIDEISEMLKSNVEKIESHGKRADSIVKNMLLHSRSGASEHRSVDINEVVEESLNLAYHGARAEKSGFNITLKRDLDPKAGMVDLYPQEITRVFLNLITNGFYAANKRKETTTATDFEPALSVTTKDLGNVVEIRIRDNGTGIPDEVKEKMFNPFFTTKPAGEGTGLGLSMSHDIVVKQHGGRIDVETQPDSFTEFLIVLPRSGTAQVSQGSKL